MKIVKLLSCLVLAAFLVTAVFSSQAQCAPVSASTHNQTTPSHQTADRNSDFFLLSNNNESLYSNKPYQEEIKRIDSLAQARNLTGLAKLADSIEQTWGHQTDTQPYFGLMDEMTNVLRSNTFASSTDFKQYKLAQKYVLLTLSHDKVPLDITANLLPRLIPEETLVFYKKPFDESGWANARSYRASLWLQTRQRLKQLVDPNYDFTSPVFINLPISVEALKDPEKDIPRLKAMQENSKKIRGRNDQLLARFQGKLVEPMAENEMIAYYSQAPYDTPELKRLLDTYVDDAATKQRILDQVAKNIASATPQ